VILRNLILNAIKFCEPNDKIEVRAERENEMVRVFVSDTGQGIPLENLEKLFGFSHLSTMGTKEEVGVGLGLVLCKEFVEKLGGSIRVSSAQGHGSTFEFTLPKVVEQAMEVNLMPKSVSNSSNDSRTINYQ
jgi:signal transduction histidine kinase